MRSKEEIQNRIDRPMKWGDQYVKALEWVLKGKESAMCEVDAHSVLSEVRDELLADAIGLLMNHEQCKDDGWQSDYNELMKKYVEHFR